MPESTFDSSLTFGVARAILADIEGVHNIDQGGDTWYGIARKFHPNEEPWPPTEERATEIYRDEYWDAAGCSLLPPALGVALFDCVVNQGADWAIRKFQQSVGAQIDGEVGNETVRRAHDQPTKETLAIFLAHRAIWYAGGRPDQRLGLQARLFRVQFEIARRFTL